jgi:hypothetical protein
MLGHPLKSKDKLLKLACPTVEWKHNAGQASLGSEGSISHTWNTALSCILGDMKRLTLLRGLNGQFIL